MLASKPTKETISHLLDEFKKGEDPIIRTYRIINFTSEDFEIDLMVDYFGVKEYTCKLSRVSEDMIMASHEGTEEYFEISSQGNKSKSALENTIETFIQGLIQKREDYLLNDMASPSPVSAKASQRIFDDDTMEDDFESDQVQDLLTCHVNDAKAYFDTKFVSLIGQM